MDKIIQEMKQLGLTEYEVKAYLALLQHHPINGYALSKHSGIPRSRIYEVLDGLHSKQIIFEHKDGKATSYTPLEPELLMKKLRQDFETTIKSVTTFTTDLFRKDEEDLKPKILKGRDEVLNMLQVLIPEAKKRITLSIWDEELQPLKSVLDKANKKNINLRGVYFGTESPYDNLVPHRRVERYIAEKDERYIIVIIDDRHCISGIISRNEKARITWSRDPGVIEINDDYIAHDVMLNAYHYQLPNDEKALYEHRLDLIRKDYYGFSDEAFDLFPLPDGQ